MNVFLPSSRFKKVLSLLLSQKKAVVLVVAAAWNAQTVSIDRSIEHKSFKETHEYELENFKCGAIPFFLRYLF